MIALVFANTALFRGSRVFSFALGSLAIALGAVSFGGCAKSAPATCDLNSDCEIGQYCGSDGICARDCVSASRDCPMGYSCNSIGKCDFVASDENPSRVGSRTAHASAQPFLSRESRLDSSRDFSSARLASFFFRMRSSEPLSDATGQSVSSISARPASVTAATTALALL